MENVTNIQAYWSLIIALSLMLIGLGILADKMWGWVWSEKLASYFDRLANRTFDLHFKTIVHEDYLKSLAKLNLLFGQKFFSKRLSLIILSVLVPLSVIGYGQESYQTNVSFFSVNLINGILLILFSWFICLVSLHSTKKIIGLTKPRTLSLIGILLLDFLVVYILIPTPYAVLSFFSPFSYYDFPIVVAMFGTIAFVLFGWVDVILYRGFEDLQYSYEYVNLVLILIVMFFSVFPSLFHILTIAYDLLHLIFLRWLYLGLCGLFLKLTATEQPVTFLLLGVVFLVNIALLLRDALPILWLLDVLSGFAILSFPRKSSIMEQ